MNEIRDVIADDLPALITLYRHLSTKPDPCALDDARTALIALARFPGSGVLAAFEDHKMRASCTLVVIPNITRGGRPFALIENVVTDLGHRQQGHAKRLLDVATDRAWHHRCYKVMLMTGSQDHGTLTFYEKAGFAQTKTGFQKRNI